VCFYVTIIAMFMDIYHHLQDRDHIIDVAMIFTLFTCESCTIMYFR